jgi:hypothetical protein
MSRIREKATESEAVVRDITKDIQALDIAKKNLVLSMTTLKRLQMLGKLFGVAVADIPLLKPPKVNALTQLEDQVKEKRYSEVAQTLAVCVRLSRFTAALLTRLKAVKQISTSFKPYTSVHRIQQVWKRVQQIQGEIRTQLETEFDAL